MGAYYDEIEIEDMTWDNEKRLANYEDIATCPSCSLVIRVIYDPLDFEDEPQDDGGDGSLESEEEEESDGASSDEDHFEDVLNKLHIAEVAAVS